MKIKFDTPISVVNMLEVNDWCAFNDEFDVQYDEIDGKPFSTQFSFSRFLLPALNMYEGLALYMDSDMYVRADISELFEMCKDNYYAIHVVNHKYEPTNKKKMDG